MAKNTVWLVGVGGSGRTTLAVALAAFHCRRPGIVCALATEFGAVHRFDADAGDFADDAHKPELRSDADFLFVEVQPSRFNSSMLRAGDHVARVERVSFDVAQPATALTAQGVAHA
ncbi:MAG: hypothetical protein Q8N13_10440 [Acidovorax sp.]|nr:hypothetical protein [Acidovorax sp.]